MLEPIGLGHDAEVDVVVVGGGITGLAAAHRLVTTGPSDLRIVLLEADEVVGGKIRTRPFHGHSVDDGPDGILDNAVLRELTDDLGLSSSLVAMAKAQPGIWTSNGIRPLPAGLVSGVPVRPGAIVRSGVLSPKGLARAGLDLVLPPSLPAHDVSVAELVGKRLGRQVVDQLVGPLIGAVYAGDVSKLSAEAVAPPLFAAAKRHRSLTVGLRREARSATAPARGLVSFAGGLGSLVEALDGALGSVIRTSTPVLAISGAPGSWEVATSETTYRTAHIIMAVPADVTARLLRDVNPAAAELAAIPYASVAIVTLAYRRSALATAPVSSGFLVPASSGHLVTACSWLSVKWPQTTDAATLLLRCSVGRSNDERWQRLDDDELVRFVRRELKGFVALRADPLETRVRRWPHALPQYQVGHNASIARVRQALGPTVLLAGAAYDGIGVTTCVAQGRKAADDIITHIRSGAPAQPVGNL